MKLQGAPIRVRFEAGLSDHGGKLLVGGDAGIEVHAATFVRARLMVLDAALLRTPWELRRIFIHELFHFAWVRMSNQKRGGWEALMLSQWSETGELGWSAERRKRELTERDRQQRTRRWRAYCCESFCDSAAWHLGKKKRHDEFTLGADACTARQQWLKEALRAGVVAV